jgi:hypothetical protein
MRQRKDLRASYNWLSEFLADGPETVISVDLKYFVSISHLIDSKYLPLDVHKLLHIPMHALICGQQDVHLHSLVVAKFIFPDGLMGSRSSYYGGEDINIRYPGYKLRLPGAAPIGDYLFRWGISLAPVQSICKIAVNATFLEETKDISTLVVNKDPEYVIWVLCPSGSMTRMDSDNQKWIWKSQDEHHILRNQGDHQNRTCNYYGYLGSTFRVGIDNGL